MSFLPIFPSHFKCFFFLYPIPIPSAGCGTVCDFNYSVSTLLWAEIRKVSLQETPVAHGVKCLCYDRAEGQNTSQYF